jgi:hypothetical protein
MPISPEVWKEGDFQPRKVGDRHPIGEFFGKEGVSHQKGVFHTSGGDNKGLGKEKDNS